MGNRRKLLLGAVLVTLSLFCSAENRGLRATDPCTDVQRLFMQKGLNISVPSTAISGSPLKVCQRSYTCCTPEIEDQLHAESVIEFEQKVSSNSLLMKAHYEKKQREFDDLFKKLISNAKKQLDALFRATYNDKYEENAYMFMQLFDDLMQYYEGAAIDINDVFDRFFVSVLQGIFKLLNPSFAIDEEYNRCLAENLRNIKPFGDNPDMLSSQVKRALIAARTFVKGLRKGEYVANEVAQVYPTTECAKGLTRMSYCSKCQGHMTLRPCYNMCLNVMKGCLLDITDINSPWNRYISQMSLVLDRLEGPFNIATVLDQIDIKISTAIMIPQDNRVGFTNKVFSFCGRRQHSVPEDIFPNPGQTYNFQSPSTDTEYKDITFNQPQSVDEEHNISKRDTPRRKNKKDKKRKQKNNNDDFDTFSSHKRKKPNRGRAETLLYSSSSILKVHNSGPRKLKKLVSDMKKVLVASKSYWNLLPSYICKEEAPEEKECWNGEGRGSYGKSVTKDGIHNQVNNPEVSVDGNRKPDVIIKQQILSLSEMVEELNLAYRGLDPTLTDENDDVRSSLDVGFSDDEDFSGSGEGSGYGDEKQQDVEIPFDLSTIEAKFFRDLTKRQRALIIKLLKEDIPEHMTIERIRQKWSRISDSYIVATNEPGSSKSVKYGITLVIMAVIGIILNA